MERSKSKAVDGGAAGVSSKMSRHRFCMTNDRDAFIEELAEEIWDEPRASDGRGSWAEASAATQRDFRKLAADTLRFLEHGHG